MRPSSSRNAGQLAMRITSASARSILSRLKYSIIRPLPAVYGYTSSVTCCPPAIAAVDARERVFHLAPVRPAGALVMRDVQVQAAFLADAQRLLHRFEQPVAFVAHVRGVQTAERLRGVRDFDHFFGAAPAAGPIDEAGRKTARALLHRAFDVAAHRREFRMRSARVAPCPSSSRARCCGRPASCC